MEDFQSAWADYAHYLPAPNANFAHFAAQAASTATSKRLPAGIKPQDLNFLDQKSRLFYWPNALYSAAFAVNDNKPDIVKKRLRSSTFILGDSGGFSLISGALSYSIASFRKAVLDWQERDCDVGIILDQPTRTPGATFEDCLRVTFENAKFALDNRTCSHLRLLQVYQGESFKAAQYWCDEVNKLPLDGIAIGGKVRLQIWFWIERILAMIDAEAFDHVKHIHFLGTSQPSFAVLATALQRALRQDVREDITISFDSSLAFTYVQKYGQITTGLDPSNYVLTKHTLPQKAGEFEPDVRFPYPSPLADRCRVADFLPGVAANSSAMDMIGAQMLSNHAVHAELTAILRANRLVDLAQRGANSVVPYPIQKGVELISDIFSRPAPDKAIKNLRLLMSKVQTDDDLERADQN